MQVNPNVRRNTHLHVPCDLFQFETVSPHMLVDALVTSLAILIIIWTLGSRDTVRELPAKEPGSYKLFIPSAFCHCFCLKAFLHTFTSDVYIP